MTESSIDILVVSHDRPSYTQLSLSRLFETCDESMSVWLWHNGQHEETLEIVRSFRSDPRVHRFHHSPENVGLREPTNWLWSNSSASFLSKLDDDCLVSDGWAQTLRRAHLDCPKLGAVGGWYFRREDFDLDLARPKIREIDGGHQILQNCWVQGTAYLLKRKAVDSQGLLGVKDSFPGYCIKLALRGWIHGWYFPFVEVEHMDDPRSPYSIISTEDAFRRHRPLTAKTFGVDSVDDWTRQTRAAALYVQSASIDPRRYVGWRARSRRARRRVLRTLGRAPVLPHATL